MSGKFVNIKEFNEGCEKKPNPFKFGKVRKVDIPDGPSLLYLELQKGVGIELTTGTVYRGVTKNEKNQYKIQFRYSKEDPEVTNTSKNTQVIGWFKTSEIETFDNEDDEDEDDEFFECKRCHSKKDATKVYSDSDGTDVLKTASSDEKFIVLQKIKRDTKFVKVLVERGHRGNMEWLRWMIAKCLFDSKEKWEPQVKKSFDSISEIFEAIKSMVEYPPEDKDWDPNTFIQLSTYQQRDQSGNPTGPMKFPSFKTHPKKPDIPKEKLENLYMEGQPVIWVSKIQVQNSNQFKVFFRLISFAIFECKAATEQTYHQAYSFGKISEEKMQENEKVLDSIIAIQETLEETPEGGGTKDNSASELDLLLNGPTMEEANADSDESVELDVPGIDD